MTKEEMFNNNINIAYKIANKYKENYIEEYDDIRQVALLGLWKSVLTFNNTYAFSTYAYTVINNEINYYLRSIKKYKRNYSFNIQITDNLILEDTLEDENNNIDILIDKIELLELRECLDDLYFRDIEKKVLDFLILGKTQTYIANQLNLTQASISRIRKRIILKLKRKYEERGIENG